MTSAKPGIAQIIRTLRLRAGLSQEELAERSGLSTRAISDMERGLRKHPRPETLRMLADGLQLDESERLRFFAVVHPEIERVAEPRAVSPVTAVAPRAIPLLPIPPDELIGREADILALDTLLAAHGRVRLITLTGPGGVGKTRLGLAIAHQIADRFTDGASLIDLAPLTDGEQIVAALVGMLGSAVDISLPPRQAVIAALRPRSMLVLFDNFEHLLPAAPLLAELLAACPEITIIVTSRVALNLRGEHRIPVEPLLIPDASASSAAALAANPAVTLFLMRAAQVEPRFALDDQNATDIAEICRSLDGLPLALELAAARVDMLSPDALRQRLTHRLPLLTSGARDLPARQQTLRAAIDWSYDFLSENERIVFRRLAVFAGGATLEAAEAIFGDSLDTPLLETLTALVTHSLLRVDPAAPDGPRFSMLETIREFASEELDHAHEAEPWRNAHATYFLDLSARAAPHLTGGPHQFEWMSRIDREYLNLRAAAFWWLSHKEVQRVLELCTNIWNYWSVRGGASEGIALIRRALSTSEDVPSSVRAAALRKVGNLSIAIGDTRAARTLFEESLAIEQEAGNLPEIAGSLADLSLVATMQGRSAEALHLQHESRRIFREIGDIYGEAVTLFQSTIVARNEGDPKLAVTHLERLMMLQQDLQDEVGIAYSFHLWGMVESDQGNFERAIVCSTQAWDRFQSAGDEQGLAMVDELRATIDLELGNLDRAREKFDRAFETYQKFGDMQNMAGCLEKRALVAFRSGDPATAMTFLSSAIYYRDQSGCPTPRIESRAIELLTEALAARPPIFAG